MFCCNTGDSRYRDSISFLVGNGGTALVTTPDEKPNFDFTRAMPHGLSLRCLSFQPFWKRPLCDLRFFSLGFFLGVERARRPHALRFPALTTA